MPKSTQYPCITVNDIDAVAWAMRDLLKAGQVATVEIHVASKQRSLSQNSSLHKYCDNIANGMNDAGIMQRQLVGSFKEGFELPVTMEMIKSIFREVGRAMFKKGSTKDLTTIEIQDIYRVVDQRFAEITGIRSEWPSVDSMRDEQEKRHKKKPGKQP